MTKMFKSVSETWNVVTGCRHACVYCYARTLAEGRLKHLKRYKDGFQAVKFHAGELARKFKPGSLVFVVDMGDLFGSWVPGEWIGAVIQHVWQFPDTDFLFLTKNPWRYHRFTFPPNAILGPTGTILLPRPTRQRPDTAPCCGTSIPASLSASSRLWPLTWPSCTRCSRILTPSSLRLAPTIMGLTCLSPQGLW